MRLFVSHQDQDMQMCGDVRTSVVRHMLMRSHACDVPREGHQRLRAMPRFYICAAPTWCAGAASLRCDFLMRGCAACASHAYIYSKGPAGAGEKPVRFLSH